MTWYPGSRPELDTVRLTLAAGDQDLVDLIERSDLTAIEAPFGWPVPFMDFLRQGSAESDDGWQQVPDPCNLAGV